MYIRCKNCHDSIWIRPAAGDALPAAARCGRCEQEHEFDVTGNSESACADLSGRAAEFAKDYGVDQPSACSVLLGLMTLEDVLGLQAAGSAVEVPEKRPPVGGPAAGRFDPTFREAVAAGRLTEAQAFARGRRDAYAARLAHRHEFPMETAYAVADNRLPLLEALRQRAPREPTRARIGSSPRIPVGKILLVLGCLFVLSVAVRFWPHDDPDARQARARTPVAASDVFTDPSGRVTRVVGPSPDDVLTAFCRMGTPEGRLEAVGLLPSSAGPPALQIGLLRDSAKTGEILAIVIRQDGSTGRWFAGDGRIPLVPSPAPANAQATFQPR